MAYDFNGTTDRIDYALPYNTAGQDTSYFAWVYFDLSAPAATPDYIFQSTATGGVAALLFDQDFSAGGRLQVQRLTDAAGMNRISATSSIATGVWTHVGFTSQGNLTASNTKIYVSGVEVAYSTTTNGTGTERPATEGLSIGGRPSDDARNFNGRVAMSGMWNRILSQSEVTALAAGMPPTALAPGLSHYAPLVAQPIDIVNANSGTADGTTLIAHPRVFPYQAKLFMYPPDAVTPPGPGALIAGSDFPFGRFPFGGFPFR